jgi:hypothetical protein
MLPFEYQEHFSGSKNLLQTLSVVVVHYTSRDVALGSCECLTQVVHPISGNIVSWV